MVFRFHKVINALLYQVNPYRREDNEESRRWDGFASFIC